MSLRRFLNVAFTIIVEEYQRIGVDLLSALERVEEWSEGAVESVGTSPTTVPSVVTAAHNQSSMTALQGMLGNVAGAPTRKPRRTK